MVRLSSVCIHVLRKQISALAQLHASPRLASPIARRKDMEFGVALGRPMTSRWLLVVQPQGYGVWRCLGTVNDSGHFTFDPARMAGRRTGSKPVPLLGRILTRRTSWVATTSTILGNDTLSTWKLMTLEFNQTASVNEICWKMENMVRQIIDTPLPTSPPMHVAGHSGPSPAKAISCSAKPGRCESIHGT